MAAPFSPPDPDAETLAAVGPRWMAAMQRGDFEAAWRETDRIELPRRRRQNFVPAPHHLTWDGSPFDDARVLVRCTHGLGDSIQFLRYVPLLRERARHVAVKVQPALLPLFAGMAGIDTLLDAWTIDPEPAHDVAIECMELAYAFRHTPATVPAHVPYLPIAEITARAQPLKLPAVSGLKVGLIWAASAWDPRRSLMLTALAPLRKIADVDFFSLQQGPERDDGSAAPFPLFPLSQQTSGLAEAASAMLAMDLIISVDGMTAHLAGALGRPVWTLLGAEADWRWMCQRSDSPWYPTMRLIRQSRPGDWNAVISEVVSRLKEAVAAR